MINFCMLTIPTLMELEKEVAIDEIKILYKAEKISKVDYEKLMSEITQTEKTRKLCKYSSFSFPPLLL